MMILCNRHFAKIVANSSHPLLVVLFLMRMENLLVTIQSSTQSVPVLKNVPTLFSLFLCPEWIDNIFKYFITHLVLTFVIEYLNKPIPNTIYALASSGSFRAQWDIFPDIATEIVSVPGCLAWNQTSRELYLHTMVTLLKTATTHSCSYIMMAYSTNTHFHMKWNYGGVMYDYPSELRISSD